MAEGENEVVVPVQVPDQAGHVVDVDHTERLVRLEEGMKTQDEKLWRSMDELRTDFSKQLDDIRLGVSDQLGSVMTKLDELTPAAPETHEAPAAPEVETTPVEPTTKKVRRGNRKVTRRG